MIKIKIVQHKPSGLVLHNNHFVELTDDLDPEGFGSISDIEYKGSCSEGIIDTSYFSPSDYNKEEWDDEDDTTDDYSEMEIKIKKKLKIKNGTNN